MPMQAQNQRWNLRAAVELPVALRERDGTVWLAKSIDLSASGIAIRAPKYLASGSPVFVAVGHESLGLHFESGAEVVRSRRDRDEYLLALRFHSLPAEVSVEIGRYVVQKLA